MPRLKEPSREIASDEPGCPSDKDLFHLDLVKKMGIVEDLQVLPGVFPDGFFFCIFEFIGRGEIDLRRDSAQRSPRIDLHPVRDGSTSAVAGCHRSSTQACCRVLRESSLGRRGYLPVE